MMDETFGAVLKRMRAAHGLSQVRLGVRAGYDHSYIARLESGSRAPTRDAVSRFAEALDLAESEQDDLLLSAGFAPESRRFQENLGLMRLIRDPLMPLHVRNAIDDVLVALTSLAAAAIPDGPSAHITAPTASESPISGVRTHVREIHAPETQESRLTGAA